MITIVLALLAGQCCGLAHEVAAESRNGRFRVAAWRGACESSAPAHRALRIRWMERDAGDWHERRAFDVRVEVGTELNPRLCVSPTGNGFLIDFGVQAFYGCDGRMWGAWEHLAVDGSQAPDASGACVPLAGGGLFFLPLGAPVTGELTREVREFLRGLPADAAAHALVARLSGDELEDREAARVELVRRGVGAVGALLAAPPDAAAEARAILDRVPRWSWLLERAERIATVAALYPGRLDVDALIEQLGDPDIEVRDRAAAALRKLGRAALPKLEAVATADLEVQWRLREVIAHVKQLQSSRAVLVRFRVDASGACTRTIEAAEPAFVRNRIEREGVAGGAESFACVIDTGAPVEWHPREYDGWREVVLRDLEGPVETDVPAVYHLLARARGFEFALEKLESLRTSDPLVARVIRKAIERQRRKE